MDTYGDMVTLLLCFFVLLYSMSSISEENWKALVMSFNPDAVQVPTMTDGNDGPFADPNEEDGAGMDEADPDVDNNTMGMAEMQAAIDAAIEDLYQALKQYVEEKGMEESITVVYGDGKVFITFQDTVFFAPDDSTLLPQGREILDAMGESISRVADSIDEVRVMGHTAQALPNRPNEVAGDRRLSAMRAANAVSYLQEHSTVDPARLISEGYGQWRPLTDNHDEEARAANRRVEMIISGRNLEEELESELVGYETVK